MNKVTSKETLEKFLDKVDDPYAIVQINGSAGGSVGGRIRCSAVGANSEDKGAIAEYPENIHDPEATDLY